MADKQSRVEQFARNIKDIRKQKNMTLKDLEERTGYSNSYLSQIENGHKGIPSQETLIKIAKGLDVSLKTMSELADKQLIQRGTESLSMYSTQELIDELMQRQKIKVKYVLEV